MSSPGARCSSPVIQVEKSWARHTRRRQVADHPSRGSVAPVRDQAARASASTLTPATARFMPLAPVGGTMWAASPARNSRPWRIGSTTKLRMPVTLLSRIGPSSRVQPASGARPARRSPPAPLAGDRPLAQGPAVVGGQAGLELPPDPAVVPVLDRLVRVDLEVQAGQLG